MMPTWALKKAAADVREGKNVLLVCWSYYEAEKDMRQVLNLLRLSKIKPDKVTRTVIRIRIKPPWYKFWGDRLTRFASIRAISSQMGAHGARGLHVDEIYYDPALVLEPEHRRMIEICKFPRKEKE